MYMGVETNTPALYAYTQRGEDGQDSVIQAFLQVNQCMATFQKIFMENVAA